MHGKGPAPGLPGRRALCFCEVLVVTFRSRPVLHFLVGRWGWCWFQEQLEVTVLSPVHASATCLWFGSIDSEKQLRVWLDRWDHFELVRRLQFPPFFVHSSVFREIINRVRV